MGGRVHVEKEGALGWIVFDHPERRNAITVDMWRAIPEAARRLDADPDVRVVVMRGAGEVAFVSGADISEFGQTRTGDAAREYDERNVDAFSALQGMSKPLLAMIHGFCVGGGCALAICADLRYAADDAVFAVPAGRLGLGYPRLGIETLLREIGPANAKDLLFTARRVPAADARHMGLVSDVVPKAELEARVRTIAEDIAANAPLTLRAVKRTMAELRKRDGPDDEAILAAVRECFHSQDYKEGVAAFLEKRSPEFKGR